MKSSQKINMVEKSTRGPSELCWDKSGAASAQPLRRSQVGANFWLLAGEHGYWTREVCTAYLGVPGSCLHDFTPYILQTTSGISF